MFHDLSAETFYWAILMSACDRIRSIVILPIRHDPIEPESFFQLLLVAAIHAKKIPI